MRTLAYLTKHVNKDSQEEKARNRTPFISPWQTGGFRVWRYLSPFAVSRAWEVKLRSDRIYGESAYQNKPRCFIYVVLLKVVYHIPKRLPLGKKPHDVSL